MCTSYVINCLVLSCFSVFFLIVWVHRKSSVGPQLCRSFGEELQLYWGFPNILS